MNIRHLTFRLLQVYVTVVRCGSISEAARQLHLTQPTVSQQLKRLREAVGSPLLEQHAQQLTMTATGQALYQASRDVLGRFDDFADQLSDLQYGSKGRFSIALVNTAQYVLPRLLGPFSQAFPDVDVTVHIGNRRQVLARFERQEDDLYVFSHPPALAHAVASRFMRNPLVAIAAADHSLAQQETVTMEQLLSERLLLREPGSATRMLLDSWLQEHGLTMQKTLQMASNEAIRVSVAANMGVAVLSEHVLPNEHPDLVVLPVQGLPIESHWQFIVRNDQRLPQSAQRFLHYAHEHLTQWIEPRFVCNELDTLLNAYPTFPLRG
ncbi:LysR family transcriptional regulator [Vreelandella venusta]|uniref:LysR family transcriptional regulator n=1 Tax=Vreelandella venusta TaxID=44935 RepID=A0AAQ0CHX6_9GAMM|nr:LysR family transcriptional regulator [Halomonas venusta]AZM94433.1 LysR family transcriptional regulator [Halomonas venusta]MDX1354072.1 LysR family transcriptional regulator [Halomonas venusta]NPT31582.1 LysR family transcriptional regulator [Halomonas venusta]QRL03671.1 LysR family transcriptional regulator [Halomonas venusta]WAM48891.1 LysR family transcriptional regulator [Halomonas venusta]